MYYTSIILSLLLIPFGECLLPIAEERERIIVEGIFLALRGSDNLVLVYAVRPAVEERLGGASSWAMKMSEAPITIYIYIIYTYVEMHLPGYSTI